MRQPVLLLCGQVHRLFDSRVDSFSNQDSKYGRQDQKELPSLKMKQKSQYEDCCTGGGMNGHIALRGKAVGETGKGVPETAEKTFHHLSSLPHRKLFHHVENLFLFLPHRGSGGLTFVVIAQQVQKAVNCKKQGLPFARVPGGGSLLLRPLHRYIYITDYNPAGILRSGSFLAGRLEHGKREHIGGAVKTAVAAVQLLQQTVIRQDNSQITVFKLMFGQQETRRCNQLLPQSFRRRVNTGPVHGNAHRETFLSSSAFKSFSGYSTRA
jgi:hypothetical protein